MSVQTSLTQDKVQPLREMLPLLLTLGLGCALLGLAFRAEIAAAVAVWYASTAYSHCFFVIPIAAYLAWDRRDAVAGVPVRPMPWVALAALPLGLAWLLVERVGVMEGRQLIAVTMLQALFLAVLGWRMWWALSAALLYLYFLVPFGAFLTPALQHFTAVFIPAGLNLLGIPNYADEYMIDIPAGRFYVAEACAGLRFLIASVAFGALYAALIYRSPWRRAGFMLASVVVPIVANGFRALGIVVLGHILGSAEAAAADHILYGWMFFSIVILLLVAAGMPFREDLAPRPATPPPAAPLPPTRRLLQAGLAVAALAAIWPATAALLDASTSGTPSLAALPAPAGCSPAPVTAGFPASSGERRWNCAVPDWPAGLELVVHGFSPQVNPGVILARQRLATAELQAEDMEVSTLPPLPGAPGVDRPWRAFAATQPYRVTAALLWLDGVPAQLGLRTRIAQAQRALWGAERPAVLVTVAAQRNGHWTSGADAEAAKRSLARFIQSQGDLLEQVRALAQARPQS